VVEIGGLKSEKSKHLNGQLGLVIKHKRDRDDGRYGVKVVSRYTGDHGREIACKEESLKL